MATGEWRRAGRYLWGFYRPTRMDPLARVGIAFVEQLGSDRFSVWVGGASDEWVCLPSKEEAMRFAEATLAIMKGGE